jgi:hypothetical protein
LGRGGGWGTGSCTGGCGYLFRLEPPAAPGGSWTKTVLFDFPAANYFCLISAVDAKGNFVGHAQSSTLTNEGLLSGFGYGSLMTAAGIVEAGESAAITLPCSGTTDGAIETNDVASVTVPGVLSTGAIHTTAQGPLTTSGASGQITASVAGLDLLSSLVTATTITADASASISAGSITLSDTGSLFVGLAVTGHPEVGANPSPNTRVSIVGLGTLWHACAPPPD